LELWLDLAAREQPDAPAVNGITYAALSAQADAWALELLDKGVRPGGRVAIGFGGVDFARILHALPRVGAVLVPINTRLTKREREAVLAAAQPTLVLDSPLEDHERAVDPGYRGQLLPRAHPGPVLALSGHVRVVALDEAGRVQRHEKLPQLREPGGSELAFPFALDLAHRSADVLRGRVAARGALDSR
jgi:non-ribosomal peptide synthetase component F